MIKQELIKPIVKLGNGAGVLLPKEWLGGEAKVQIVRKPTNIKEDTVKILNPYFEHLRGIYLVGSHARGEQTKDSDIDIIAISDELNKEITLGKYHISIYRLETTKKALEKNPLTIYPRLIEAKVILNKTLLKELQSIKPSKEKFKDFLKETKRIIKINKEILELDRLDGEYLISTSIIYSLILRLRGIFILKMVLNKEEYSNRSFKKWLSKTIDGESLEKVYKIYTALKNNKELKIKLKISIPEKLLNLLEKEVRILDEKKKTSA